MYTIFADPLVDWVNLVDPSSLRLWVLDWSKTCLSKNPSRPPMRVQLSKLLKLDDNDSNMSSVR